MWQPEPGWLALPGGSSASTVGVWRTVLGDQPVVVKRLGAPLEDDPAELTHPRHFAWWRRSDRRALYVAYGLGLAGILAVAYLTYLELFVIEAICVWCVTYAVTIVAGWLTAAAAAWRTSD